MLVGLNEIYLILIKGGFLYSISQSIITEASSGSLRGSRVLQDEQRPRRERRVGKQLQEVGSL